MELRLKMSIIIRSIQIFALSGLIFLPSISISSELDVDKLMHEFESQLEISQDKFEKLKPELKSALEAKSRELSTSLDLVLEQGLTELEKMGEKYEAASKESSEKLQEFLDSEDVTEFKEFLSGLDEDAIREARDQLVAEFMQVLQLTADQIEIIKPLIREKLEHLGAILNRYLNEGKHDFEQFRVEFEAESQKGIEQFKAILDDHQQEKFEEQLDSMKESIRTEIFEA